MVLPANGPLHRRPHWLQLWFPICHRRGARRLLRRVFADDREADLTSVDALLAIVREHVTATGEVQLYAVWDGKEGNPPKGVISVDLDSLNRETFFLYQQFIYRITADAR